MLTAVPAYSAPALEPSDTEVAVSFDEPSIARIKEALAPFKQKSKEGEVVLFDTVQRTLFGRGIVVRLRAFEGEEEITLKVRSPRAFPQASLWKNWESKCERDLSPYSARVACSITSPLMSGSLKNLLEGKKAPHELVPVAFWRFAEEVLGSTLPHMSLRVTEPAKIKKWKYVDAEGFRFGVPGELVLEVWKMPNGIQLPELSLKDRSTRANGRLQQLLHLLASQRVETVDLNPSKSEQFLEYLQ